MRPEEIVTTAASILLEDLTQLTDSVRFVKLALAAQQNEHFAALFLSIKYRVLHFERLFSGAVNCAAAYSRVVVKKVRKMMDSHGADQDGSKIWDKYLSSHPATDERIKRFE